VAGEGKEHPGKLLRERWRRELLGRVGGMPTFDELRMPCSQTDLDFQRRRAALAGPFQKLIGPAGAPCRVGAEQADHHVAHSQDFDVDLLEPRRAVRGLADDALLDNVLGFQQRLGLGPFLGGEIGRAVGAGGSQKILAMLGEEDLLADSLRLARFGEDRVGAAGNLRDADQEMIRLETNFRRKARQSLR
jgi:hypothetical protein